MIKSTLCSSSAALESYEVEKSPSLLGDLKVFIPAGPDDLNWVVNWSDYWDPGSQNRLPTSVSRRS